MFKLKSISFLFIILIAFGFLFIIFSMQVTSTPRFCGSCHIMLPYYQSWLASSHNKIACVECHIAPGVTSEFRKKYEALSMIAKYFTGTYSTNPWTEVEDESCLQCHERRLLAGTEIFDNVLFDHKAHLTEMKRQKRLRCTSCHSQIVQGSHIAVTASTCFLCHFKDQKFNENTARCTICHEIPDKIITRNNLVFNHGDVKRFGMQCVWCHAHVIQGNGEVLKERCYTCHNDPKRLSRFKDTEYLHRNHVTIHKVECIHCHSEIMHKTEQKLETVSSACSTCHMQGHSYQRDLYVGIGGKETKPHPSLMYQAGVRCEGCHFLPPKEGTVVARANEISCMACHGASYRKIYFAWQDYIGNKLEKTDKLYNFAIARIDRENRYLKEAKVNLNIVKTGKGIHNVEYSVDLMNEAQVLVNKALQEKGMNSLVVPVEKLPYEARCWACHLGIENAVVTALGNAFSHKLHVFENGIDCLDCHSEHPVDQFKIDIKFKPGQCKDCHHTQNNPDQCLKCHASVKKTQFKINKSISVALKIKMDTAFSHAMHIDDLQLKCSDCHLLDQPAGASGPALNLKKCKECHE